MSDLQVHASTITEMKELCHLSRLLDTDKDDKILVALTYVYGSWNPPFEQSYVNQRLNDLLNMKQNGHSNSLPKENAIFFTGSLQVDETEESMAQCLGDNDHHQEVMGNDADMDVPCPPEHLPVLAISVQTPSSSPRARIHYVTDILPSDIISYFKKPTSRETTSWFPVLQSTILRMIAQMNSIPRRPTTTQNSNKQRGRTDKDQTTNSIADDDSTAAAIRIFVAGDRSSVGKSSVCLGILGNLVNHFGYEPSSLAYIKPATQSESPQLVQKYCDSIGIECEPIGPLVYYKGFTRAFLAGETGHTTEDLLWDCGKAVDKIAVGKKVVLVDGVGFPAVGSICGTDNASVSRACGYPTQQSSSAGAESSSSSRSPMGVIVVGGSGVGAAVDAFNLNATYFEIRNVPVMGAIFNKLSTEGFYSLENCRTQVTRYFTQNEHQQRMGRTPFGFVPQFPALSGDDAMNRVEEFLRVFSEHVNIQAILDSARRVKGDQVTSSSAMDIDSPLDKGRTAASNKRPVQMAANKENGNTSGRNNKRPRLARKDIEQLALQQGAPPSA